jgi:superfamily II DNA or RNA helicase
MKLIIDNQLRLLNAPEELRSWFATQLTFDNPLYLEAVKRNRYLRDIHPHIYMYKPLPDGIVLPRGYLQLIEGSMVGKGLDLSIKDNRVLLPPISIKSNIILRSYQKEAKLALLSHPNGMLIAPAGSGKTIMGLDIFASVRQKMLWLTHTNKLFDQVVERILEVFPDVSREEIGLIGGGKMDIGDRITIGMIPTLARKESILPEIGKKFGLVIIDECHHLAATTFIKVASYFSSYYLYACTASVHRRDGLENMLYAAAGLPNAIIKRKSVREEGGIITPELVVRQVPALWLYEGNDFNYIIKELVIPNQNRLLLITNDIVREAREGRHCIAISTRKQY